MKVNRPSTSPGILPSSYDDFTIGLSSRFSKSTLRLARPSTARPTSRGSIYPKSRPATTQSPSFHLPWEAIEPPPPPFDEHSPPSTEQLELAAKSWVVSESGLKVAFGSLWQHQKTIVIFIRHFLCPMCQDYVVSIVRSVAPEALRRAGMRLVIISNGHHEFIKSYRKIMKCPFDIYTDPRHEAYTALGMTLQTMEKGPRPSYVRHGAIGGVGMVIANAFKSGMPLWRHGGDIAQLGGEFVLGPGMKCSFSHRMRYVRSHFPIHSVVQSAIAEPEGSRLPEILVIGNDYTNGFSGFTSSHTSVLEVFYKDHRDEEDFNPANPTIVKKRSWNLPSTRRSWIIHEDEEDERSDPEPDRTTDKGKSSDNEDDFESELEPETAVESDHETIRGSVTATEGDGESIKAAELNDQDEPMPPTMTTVDWRRVRRGSVPWHRPSNNACSTVRSGDVPHPGLALIWSKSRKPVPSQDIPKDVSSSETSRNSTSTRRSADSSIGCDSDSSSTLSEEAQVCEAFVLKLLPVLDLDVSLKFDEFPWLEGGADQYPPSRRSSLQSLQLDPQFLTSSKDRSLTSTICKEMCAEVWA